MRSSKEAMVAVEERKCVAVSHSLPYKVGNSENFHVTL